MVADFTKMGYQVDRETAREMIAALSYNAALDQTAYAHALEQQRKEREDREAYRAAKKAAKRAARQSDTASVNSFGSTVSLLRSKLSRKH